MINRDNRNWPFELRRSFPWIIWRIWKNRNLFFFEGKRFTALETIEKVRKDVEDWCAAQVVEGERMTPSLGGVSGNVSNPVLNQRMVWKPPPKDWVKCNVGFSWSKETWCLGTAWVLRDEKGEVLLHSRRAFSNIKSKFEAQVISIVWSVESMVSHKVSKVMFAVEDALLVGIINRPHAWPSFRFQSSEILGVLCLLMDWSLVFEGSSANRGANLIAQSVTNDCRFHSYVATSFPLWLEDVFRNERVLSSS